MNALTPITESAKPAMIFDKYLACQIIIKYDKATGIFSAKYAKMYYNEDTNGVKTFSPTAPLVTTVEDVLVKGASVPELLTAFGAIQTAIVANEAFDTQGA